MNVAHSGALLALLCYLLCAFNVAATAQPQQTCTIRIPANAGTVPFSNCSQFCCATQVVSAYSANALVGCCHDGATDVCPSSLGMKCCTPSTAPAVANQQSRDCYSEAQQGCCQWKARTGFDTTTNSITFEYKSKTYFKDTHQCCATTTTMLEDGDDPIVPKWVTSCTQYLLDASKPMLCQNNASCPLIDGVQTACCRRPQQTQPTAEAQSSYDGNYLGYCYDPRTRSCCGGIETPRQQGDTYKSNVTYADAELYDPRFEQCCKIPLDINGGITFKVDNQRRCPCTAAADCPTAQHTCCAPSEVELQSVSGTQGKRLVKCDPGCPVYGVNPTLRVSYFHGCTGQCMAPTGTVSTSQNEVCLTGDAFSKRCDNVRFRNGATLSVPSADQLIVKEWQTHGYDCCATGTDVNSYSVLYNTESSGGVPGEVCCPVVGTSRRDKNFNLVARYLSPVVHQQSTNNLDPSVVDACLCISDSDCPGTQKCCANANFIVSQGQSNLQYKNYAGLCYDPALTDCCAYKTTNFGSNYSAPVSYDLATLYNPVQSVCCAQSGVAAMTSSCGCHQDSDCPGPYGACCMGTQRVANQSHSSGVCIDSRYEGCCHFATLDVNYRPMSNKELGWAPTKALPYNNQTQYCCAWGGPVASVNACPCRYDGSDCPVGAQCCAGNNSALAPGEYKYSTLGYCYWTETQGCCDFKWRTKNDYLPIYQKKRQVCCPLNGVGTDHRDCACAASGDCPADGECCTDAEAKAAGVKHECRFDSDQCRGRCVHKEIETCCDNPHVSEWEMDQGVKACASAFQKCCDGQCCNKATQTCKKSTINSRMHAWNTAAWSTYDTTDIGYHFGLDEEQKKCTVLEHSSPSIVFHTWVFPTFLSIAAILFIVIGTKSAFSTDISPNMLKLGLVALEIFVGIMSLLLLWSPLWKYGFVIVVANTVILTSFSVAGVWTRRFAVVVAVVCFLWVVEPFGSNSILNFGTTTFAGIAFDTDGPTGPGGAWYNAHGLNYAARLLGRPRGHFNSEEYEDACTLFYQYWRVDPALHDQREWNPLSPTRGICRRSWMHTIVVMAGLITPFQTIFLLLAGLAIARATAATKDMKVQPLA